MTRQWLSRLVWIAWGSYCLWVWYFDRHEHFWQNVFAWSYLGVHGVTQVIKLKPITFGIGRISPPGDDEFSAWMYWFAGAISLVAMLFGIWNLNT